MKFKRKAFTLTELLVVVIVLGVLAGVSAPKLMRVLEARRTTEAENMLSAVRTEQEQRCLAGKQYATNKALFPVLAEADRSGNYNYTLQTAGAVASRKNADYGDPKYYELRMNSYKTGELCCSGAYCSSLNKDYPSCSATEITDECAAEVSMSVCEETPESCSCETYAAGHCQCTNSCNPCDENPNQCGCSAYEAANQCFCAGIDPNSCACEAYAATHACECQKTKAACGCTEEQTLNQDTLLCEDPECNNEYSAWTNTTENVVDTCPGGNANSAYTCDGTWSGTCQDVSGLETARIGTSGFAAADPFSNFRNTILLAAKEFNEELDFVDNHESLSDNEQVAEDLGGGIPDAGRVLEEGESCPNGFHWDQQQQTCMNDPFAPQEPGDPAIDCTSLCSSNRTSAIAQGCSCGSACGPIACLGDATLNPITCQCESSAILDPGAGCAGVTCKKWQTLNESTCECEDNLHPGDVVLAHRVRTVTCCAGKVDPPETCSRTCPGNFALDPTDCTCKCPAELSARQTCSETANASWNETSCSCIVSEDPGSRYECTAGQTNSYTDPNDSNKTCTQNCLVLKGQTGGTWGGALCSCIPRACPGNKTQDPDTCECVESEVEETITCLTSSYWQTYTETMTGSCTLATGQWTPDYSTQLMLTKCGGAVGFISCTAGQQCDCVPGKKYVVWDSNIYSCVAEGACNRWSTESYTRKYGFYCATCGEVSSTSQCSATWANMTGKNCSAGGSGSGSESLKPTRDEMFEFAIP